MDDDILPLIHGCLINDSASWNTLIQTCTSVAINILRKRYTSLAPDEIDNVISNIYTKLVDGGLKNFRGETGYELLKYFETITRNETISYFRQSVKRNRDVSLDQTDDEDGHEFPLQHLLKDNKLRPDTIVEINDLYRRAMEQLSVKDQQILLFKIEGYTDTEIAELLDIPMGTVASRYNRAKELLHRTLIAAILIILSGRNLPWMTSL
jgi:RNA polymerase sigma-70 factor, ECF subfamily